MLETTELFPVAAIGACILAGCIAFLTRYILSSKALGWLLGLAPLAVFAAALSLAPGVIARKDGVTATWPWIPSLGLNVTFHLDGLSVLFVLLVSGIGAAVLIYGGYYMAPAVALHDGAPAQQKAPSEGRFFGYLLLFMASMLGLVMAGDVMTLFVFWEGTSILSFLLVAYKYKDEAARKGAFKALFITGGGGIALLAGLIMAAVFAGTTDIRGIIAARDILQTHVMFEVMLVLIAIDAFTKSAQFPAHGWLPDAMSAPTPASAYLHSATMVKAGIYLMARLQPALGGNDFWFWLLTIVGGLTLITGAILGLRQHDLKALLAYSTISQLGALMLLIGQREGEAFKALVIGILAHALYKGALFMVAGAVDHSAGTRDLRKLGGLRNLMPLTFGIAALAALSMAGIPPTFGFLGKETLLVAATADNLPGLAALLLPIITTATGALLLVQAAILVYGTFIKPAGDVQVLEHAHAPPVGMLIGPGFLVALGLTLALLPLELPTLLLKSAATAAYGDAVKVSLALWTGFNLPLLLSVIAIGGGSALFYFRASIVGRLPTLALPANFSPRADMLYEGALRGFDRAAWLATRLQSGHIRRYIALMIIGAAVLFAWFNALPLPALMPNAPFNPTLDSLRVVGLLITVGASLASVVLARDLHAVLALAASGVAMALLIMVEPSPDVALVQIIVDILTTVVLVLALSKLPGLASATEKRAGKSSGRRACAAPVKSIDGVVMNWRDAGLALAAGIAMSVVCYSALATRPRLPVVTPYYEANSKPLTGAADIVGAIVVDFRGFDTMIEITVFSMAGIGVYTLLRHARKKNDHHLPPPRSIQPQPLSATITGIGGLRTSPFVHALAYFVLPLAFMIGLVHILYGHDQPGDGFTAGVIISLALAFCYTVFGYEHTRARMSWVRPHWLIGLGILTVMTGSLIPALMGLNFFAPVDFGALMGLPLPNGVFLSTSTLFEIAICLAVMGSSSHIIDTLGRPETSEKLDA